MGRVNNPPLESLCIATLKIIIIIIQLIDKRREIIVYVDNTIIYSM